MPSRYRAAWPTLTGRIAPAAWARASQLQRTVVKRVPRAVEAGSSSRRSAQRASDGNVARWSDRDCSAVTSWSSEGSPTPSGSSWRQRLSLIDSCTAATISSFARKW